VGIGLGVGLPVALTLSYVMAIILSGVVALDSITFIGFATMLATIAAWLATYRRTGLLR
jgi:hypothetical protein